MNPGFDTADRHANALRWVWRAVVLLVLLALLAAVAASAAGPANAGIRDSKSAVAPNGLAPPAPVAAATWTHRPLRQNVESTLGAATDPERFDGYAGARPFAIVPQKDKLPLFPCTQCHNEHVIKPNPVVRKLSIAPHNNTLEHGHLVDDRDYLHTLAGAKVDFNDAYLVCGQCHFNRQKDWYFGAHGKRAANWQGERVLFNCTHCHNPHNPVIQPRKPSPPPPVRAGLEPMAITREPAHRAWDPATTGAKP
jgi:hypothetical protein